MNALEKLFQEEDFAEYKIDLKQNDIEKLKNSLYKNFFEYLDGIDNGINRYPKEVKPLY